MAGKGNVITPEFRVSYPNVFKPSLNKFNNKMEFSVEALFPKGCDLTRLKTAAKDACIAEWGPDEKKWPANLRNPFKDQAEKIKIDSETGKEIVPPGIERGAIFMRFKSEQKPAVVDKDLAPIIVSQDFYGGCFAYASVRASAYNKGTPGVTFYLGNLQKTKDGDPFGMTRSTPEGDFAPIANVATGNGVAAPTSATSLFD